MLFNKKSKERPVQTAETINNLETKKAYKIYYGVENYDYNNMLVVSINDNIICRGCGSIESDTLQAGLIDVPAETRSKVYDNQVISVSLKMVVDFLKSEITTFSQKHEIYKKDNTDFMFETNKLSLLMNNAAGLKYLADYNTFFITISDSMSLTKYRGKDTIKPEDLAGVKYYGLVAASENEEQTIANILGYISNNVTNEDMYDSLRQPNGVFGVQNPDSFAYILIERK